MCRSLPSHGQADLAAERCKARIVLLAQDEGIEEEVHDGSIAVGPDPPRVPALGLDSREHRMKARRAWLQFDGPADCPLGQVPFEPKVPFSAFMRVAGNHGYEKGARLDQFANRLIPNVPAS